MRLTRRTLLLSTFLAVGCSSKVTQTVDATRLTILECFPPHLAILDELIDFADLWRLNGGNDPADPAGLVWSEQGNGTINYTITVTGFTLSGVISFYSPVGAGPLNLNISSVSLSQAIDDAATEMRNMFGATDPFMVGTWVVTDTGGAVESGSGALTGIIGGVTGANELEEVRTTTGTPAGGPPPNATGSMTIVDGADTCTFTFDTPHAPATVGLRTDDSPTQDYPNGTIHFTLAGPDATVEADLTFDMTVIARLTVTGISGRFDVNLETRTVTYVP